MKEVLKEKINYFVKFIKDNWTICIILLFSLVLHIFSMMELGYDYTLNSDDASYIKSGITFLETGKITMHGVLSAQIMPGMTFLIALFALIFGTGKIFLISLKLFWMDNIILTETPSILLFSLLVYHTLKIAKEPNKKDYILIVIYYIMAVFIRPNIGIFPLFLFIYLLLKKYDFKLLLKQCVIAGVVLLITIIPWAYRNYKIFDKFIPLTYGMGNPLLLGTYQGVGYPNDEELDYKSNVDDKLSKEMKYYLENKEEKDYLTKYYSLEYDGMIAKYRMDEWWKNDKFSMLKSYLIYKPIVLIYNYFYWDTIFGIEGDSLNSVRMLEIVLFIISSIVIFIDKRKIKEWLFLILVYGSQVALYSYTYAFSRYAISIFFIRYIIIGIGFSIMVKKIKQWRKKYESIGNNTGI